MLRVQPLTHRSLRQWEAHAQTIPDPELRRQALASLAAKKFHCEGGALYSLLAGDHYEDAIRFIVAYQTISDYLDNLCDRSTSQDPDDFSALHEAMRQALSPGAPATAYYRFRSEQNDGGYLAALAQTCQSVLSKLPDYSRGADAAQKLAALYIDLQVHKHVRKDERLPRLQAWFAQHEPHLPPMTWYEFAASTGSTLGIFCIVSQLFHPSTTRALIDSIQETYFPWVQGLHILLDYLIDQEEDRKGEDLNFCAFYGGPDEMAAKIGHFYTQAQKSVAKLPEAKFHHLINRGLLSIYLSDVKVSGQKDVQTVAKTLLRLGGLESFLFYLHCWIYRRLT